MISGFVQHGARNGTCRCAPSWLRLPLQVMELALAAAICFVTPVAVQAADAEPDEYALKAAYIFNFASFTEWPADIGDAITLCIYGPDPFGAAIDAFDGADVNGRRLQLRRIATVDQLDGCQIVFISQAMIGNLPRVLDDTQQKPVLNVADSPAAAREGAGINMVTEEGKIGFEVNLGALHDNGLNVNFQLLRLAREVYQ